MTLQRAVEKAVCRFPGIMSYIPYSSLRRVIQEPHTSRKELSPSDIRQLTDILENRFSKLKVDIATVCNADCTFCAYKYKQRPHRIMSNEPFEFILNRFVDYGGGSLDLTPLVGEPLLDPNLIKKIEMAKARPEIRHLYFFTNLIALDKVDVPDLLLSGVDQIRVSTCLGDREMYRRVFGVDRYTTVMGNLEALLKENQRLANKVEIVISVRCEKPGSRVLASDDYKYMTKLAGSFIEVFDDDFINWTGLIDEVDLPSGQNFVPVNDRREPCYQLYEGLTVFENGDAGICDCVDFNATLIVGNVHRETLDRIWQGDPLEQMRRDWVKGQLPRTCEGCNRYIALPAYLYRKQAQIRSSRHE